MSSLWVFLFFVSAGLRGVNGKRECEFSEMGIESKGALHSVSHGRKEET